MESMTEPPDSPARIQQEVDNLRLELEGERELLQQHVSLLVQQNLTLAECTREQLDLCVGLIQTDSMMFAVNSFNIFKLCVSAESCNSSRQEPIDKFSFKVVSLFWVLFLVLCSYLLCFTLFCSPAPSDGMR